MIKHHVQLIEIGFGQCLYTWQHYNKDQNTIWQDYFPVLSYTCTCLSIWWISQHKWSHLWYM